MICNWNRETVKVNDLAIDTHGTVAIVTTMYYQNTLVLGYMFTIGSLIDVIPDIADISDINRANANVDANGNADVGIGTAECSREKVIVYHFLPTKMISRQSLPGFDVQIISGYKNYTQAFYDMFTIVDGCVLRREKPLREQKLNTLIEQTQSLINILRDMYAK